MERRIVEENKLTTVFVVRIDSTLDCSTDTDIKVFSTYEKAKAYFDECVADEKANDYLRLLNDKVVIEEENCFYIYEDGHWSEPRYQISIEERMVH